MKRGIPIGPWRAFLIRCGVPEEGWWMADALVLSLFAIGVLVAMLIVLHGCESKANALPGRSVSACPPASADLAEVDEKVGGCGPILGNQALPEGQGERTSPVCLGSRVNAGQPPILNAVAPAGSRAGTCFGVEPPPVSGDGPGGLRFKEGESGRGETRTLQGKQANASADLLAWTSTEADRYPPSLDALLEAIIAYESRNETIQIGRASCRERV